MLAKRQLSIVSCPSRGGAYPRFGANKRSVLAASTLASCMIAASLLPVHAVANDQPPSLAERAPAFDGRALLTQAASLADFRKSAPAEAAWDAQAGGEPVLALSVDLAGYLERSGTPVAAQIVVAPADAPRAKAARADTARATAAQADAAQAAATPAEVARVDAARAAIRRIEQQSAAREAQRATQREEQQRRAAVRDGVRPPLRLTDEQLNIARFVADRYRVSFDHVQHFVAHAYDAAREFRLDPHLVLAVVAIESSFNPKARSKKGAQGLMQVLTRVHTEKFAPFGGPSAAFDPVANLRVGSRILKEYLVREGSVEGALKSYVGAALLKHDFGYGKKVLTERKRIAAAAEAAPFDGDVKYASGADRAGAAKGKAASRDTGKGYVKVAVTGFGDPDGESSAQRLLKSPIGY